MADQNDDDPTPERKNRDRPIRSSDIAGGVSAEHVRAAIAEWRHVGRPATPPRGVSVQDAAGDEPASRPERPTRPQSGLVPHHPCAPGTAARRYGQGPQWNASARAGKRAVKAVPAYLRLTFRKAALGRRGPAQELLDLGLDRGLNDQAGPQAGDLLQHLAEVVLLGEEDIDLATDLLSGRYS